MKWAPRVCAGALALYTGTAHADRRYAVVVGANRGDAAESPLRFANQDARRFSEVLMQLGEFQPDDLTALANPTADQVRDVLGRLAHRIATDTASADPTEGALLVFYYSGHADADALHLGGTRLPLSELQSAVETIPVDVRLLVVDACRAGELTRKKGAAPAEPFNINVQDDITSDGMAIITSAAAGEDAHESDRLAGGVFTHHLIAGLQGAADSSGDDKVTLTEAYRYSYGRTVLTTSRAPTVQHPTYRFDLRGQHDVVLTRMSQSTQLGRLRLASGGEYILSDPKGSRLVSEFDVGDGATVALPPGRYLVRRRSPARVEQGTIVLEPGGLTVLTLSDLRAMPYGQTARRGGTTDRHSALSAHMGGGVSGALTGGFGMLQLGQLGVRWDLPAISLQTRVRASTGDAENPDLAISQRSIGAELGALKLVDLGRWSVGPGLAMGFDTIQQTFDTTGDAPTRTATAGRLTSRLRAEWSPGARWSVGLEGGIDAALFPRDSDRPEAPDLQTRVVPHAAIDLSFWLF